MGIRVNLSDAGEGFDPVPAGRYPLNVFDGEIRESGESAKHPGASYIAWEFIIAGGDHEGQHVWDNTVLDHTGCDCDEGEKFNKGLFKLKNLLASIGKWSPEELDADEFDFEIDDVLGSVVAATVTIRKSEEYGDSNIIKRYRSVDDAELASSSSLP